MEVIIQPDAESAALLVARIMAKELRAKPQLVMGLATGRTMEAVYQHMVQMHKKEGLDFSLAQSFNLDEYVGIPATHPESYRSTMNRLLFSQVNIDIRNTNVLNGMAPDLEAECVRYEQAIVKAGGIDIQLLGIGQDGHIGFNEPLSALRSRTRPKALTPVTIKQNTPFFGKAELMPKRALTMGVGTILDARRCLMLVTGGTKAEIAAKAVEGPITAMISATALQLHARCTVVVDEAAGAMLQGSDYYRFVFENEPEWAEFR